MADKDDNRCWPGYEPVKGKPAHSKGSCKPKAESKSTPPEKQFRAKRRQQLDKWEEEHPHTKPSASQHLSSPTGTKKRTATKKKAGAPKGAKKTTAKRKTAAKRSK